jgi:hypothetical protein
MTTNIQKTADKLQDRILKWAEVLRDIDEKVRWLYSELDLIYGAIAEIEQEKVQKPKSELDQIKDAVKGVD